jgi:hypothetical protein
MLVLQPFLFLESPPGTNEFGKLWSDLWLVTKNLGSQVNPVVQWSPVKSTMFVAIIGTRFSGKTSIETYLVSSKGFICVRLLDNQSREKLKVHRESSHFLLITYWYGGVGYGYWRLGLCLLGSYSENVITLTIVNHINESFRTTSSHLFLHFRRITRLCDGELEKEFCHLRPLE